MMMVVVVVGGITRETVDGADIRGGELSLKRETIMSMVGPGEGETVKVKVQAQAQAQVIEKVYGIISTIRKTK